MATWPDFRTIEPEMAEAGRALLYEVGVGLAFLGTVRADGGPRVHPICPLINEHGLFAFIVPSPKQQDLLRDPRYVLHSIPLETNEDAFYVSGHAQEVHDPSLREVLADQFVKEREALQVPPPDAMQKLFRLGVDTAMVTRTTGHGDLHPRHTVWRAEPDGLDAISAQISSASSSAARAAPSVGTGR